MASSTLEQARAALQDMEALERSVMVELDTKTRTHKETVMRDHRLKKLLDKIEQRGRTAKQLTEDKDGMRKDEVSTMRGTNMFNAFYEALTDIRNYHRRFTAVEAPEPEPVDDLELELRFTGEESFGKYLDLYESHEAFVNLPGVSRVDYLAYLNTFIKFESVPLPAKGERYVSYLRGLLAYLRSFFQRTQPLLDPATVEAKAEEAFAAKWESGDVPGWPRDIGAPPPAEEARVAGGVDLDNFSSAEQLEKLGLIRLKDALVARGLKCGGTLQERAQRLFSVKGLDPEEYPVDLLAVAAPKKRKKRRGAGGDSKEAAAAAAEPKDARQLAQAFRERHREVAALEDKVRAFIELLSSVLQATKRWVEKKQIYTYEELEAELAQQEEAERAIAEDEEEDLSDEEQPIYNPKNLPLGWDGKPIPYWLYKLHGLNQEFNCEICGNVKYRGRRNFDRHFQEARHASGMRCLGIPNTKHFHGVTIIKDALALYAQLGVRVREESFQPDKEEEFEDAQGNVLSRRMYEDLRRQGLLEG